VAEGCEPMKIDPEKFALAVVMSDTKDTSLDVKINLYRYAYERAVKMQADCQQQEA
jgi:hypothetical protein